MTQVLALACTVTNILWVINVMDKDNNYKYNPLIKGNGD